MTDSRKLSFLSRFSGKKNQSSDSLDDLVLSSPTGVRLNSTASGDQMSPVASPVTKRRGSMRASKNESLELEISAPPPAPPAHHADDFTPRAAEDEAAALGSPIVASRAPPPPPDEQLAASPPADAESAPQSPPGETAPVASPPPSAPKSAGKPPRESIAREILSTEKTYVESLAVLKEVFEAPLRDAAQEKPIIELDEVKSIFAHLDPIVAYNSMFYEKLRAKIEGDNWDNETTVLGSLFTELAAFLKSYSMYINNFSHACKLIDKLSDKRPRFQEFLRTAKDDPRSRSKGIVDFLIMPVQRIPRYNLLLTDLLKHTSAEHVDHNGIETALNKIREVADFINEAKAAQDDYLHVSDLQSRFVNTGYNLLRGKRKLIREDEVMCVKLDGLNDPIQDDAFMYFFSDCIIFAVKSRKKIDVKNWIWLQELTPMSPDLMSFSGVSENAMILTFDMERVNERRKEERVLRGLEEGEITFLVASMTVDGMTKLRIRVQGEKLVREFMEELAAKCGFEPSAGRLLYKNETMDYNQKLKDYESLSMDSVVHLMPTDDVAAFPSLKGLAKRSELVQEDLLVDFAGDKEKRGLQVDVVKEEFKMNPHSEKAPQVIFYVPDLAREESEYLLKQITDRVTACHSNPVSIWKMMQSAEQKIEDAVSTRQSFMSTFAKNLMSPAQRRGSAAPVYEDPKVTMRRIREERRSEQAHAPAPAVETVAVRLIPINQLPVNQGGSDSEGGGGDGSSDGSGGISGPAADVFVDPRALLREYNSKAVPKPPGRKRDSVAVTQSQGKPPPPPPKPRATSMIELRGKSSSAPSISDRINAQIAAAEAEAAAKSSASPLSPKRPGPPPKPSTVPLPPKGRRPSSPQVPQKPTQAAVSAVDPKIAAGSANQQQQSPKPVAKRPHVGGISKSSSMGSLPKNVQPAAAKFKGMQRFKGGGGGGGAPPKKGFKKMGAGPGSSPKFGMKKKHASGQIVPPKTAAAAGNPVQPGKASAFSPASASGGAAPHKKTFAEIKAEAAAKSAASPTSSFSHSSPSKAPERPCYVCKRDVPVGEGVKMGQSLVHEQCARCYYCKKDIDGKFVRDDGHFVCLPCEDAYLGPQESSGGNPPCAKCGKALVGTTVVHDGKEYHKATCFVCVVCGVSFGSDGYLTNDFNEPVCDLHARSSSSKPAKSSMGGARGGLSLDTLAQMGMLDDDDDNLANKRPIGSSPPSGNKSTSGGPPPPPPGRRR